MPPAGLGILIGTLFKWSLSYICLPLTDADSTLSNTAKCQITVSQLPEYCYNHPLSLRGYKNHKRSKIKIIGAATFIFLRFLWDL
jgi:hypothetical protein